MSSNWGLSITGEAIKKTEASLFLGIKKAFSD
jgi:hypothetical protein